MSFRLARRSRGIADAIRLLLCQDVRKSFWSEQWIDVGTLLSAISDRLGHDPAIRRIAIDNGWWEDRDLTIVRGSTRVDVQTLIEDHGGGRCLCRFRLRLRVSSAAISALWAALALMLFQVGGPVALCFGAIAACVAIADVVVTSIAIETVVADVAAETGMSALGSITIASPSFGVYDRLRPSHRAVR